MPFDLHVLSTPPAFILSQNQTLHQDSLETEVPSKSESQTSDSKTRLTTGTARGATPCLLQYFFDERRVLLDQAIVARTGFWLSFFRFQGATTHATGSEVRVTNLGIAPSNPRRLPRYGDAYPTSAWRKDASLWPALRTGVPS